MIGQAIVQGTSVGPSHLQLVGKPGWSLRLISDYSGAAEAPSLSRAGDSDGGPVHRLSRSHRGEPDPVAAAWIICLMIAALALAWSGLR